MKSGRFWRTSHAVGMLLARLVISIQLVLNYLVMLPHLRRFPFLKSYMIAYSQDKRFFLTRLPLPMGTSALSYLSLG